MATNKSKTSLSVYLLCCLIFPVWGLSRVDNRTNWRAANATRLNSVNQGWKPPLNAQWGRNNQTATGYNTNHWTRQNNTNHGIQQPHHPVGWGPPNSNATYAPRPQLNNPWMRNNQTAHPQYSQQNIGWGARPSTTADTANKNFGFGQPNWNGTQPNTWGTGVATNLPNQSNGGWSRPSYNGTSSFNAGSGWNLQPNNFTRPYAGFPPASNNFGFGQSNLNRTLPQTSIPQSPNAAGWGGAYNGTFPGFNPPPQSQPNQSVGGGWNPGYNAGQTPPAAPLAPIGGNVAPIGFGGAAALAPLAGGGGQASLSYANGQQLPAGYQKPVGSGTNPYANLFN